MNKNDNNINELSNGVSVGTYVSRSVRSKVSRFLPAIVLFGIAVICFALGFGAFGILEASAKVGALIFGTILSFAGLIALCLGLLSLENRAGGKGNNTNIYTDNSQESNFLEKYNHIDNAKKELLSNETKQNKIGELNK